MNLEKFLQDNFPYTNFIHSQKKIIESVLKTESLLALMPTGAGKSLCYQYPAKILDGLIVVISPLVALMQDQEFKARQLGIRTIAIHSGLESDERQKRYHQLREKRIKLVFVTPERFRKIEFRDAIKENKTSLMVVDEAHCISLWGHDFRPDYYKLKDIRHFLGSPPVLALTATATKETQIDILRRLGIESAPIIEAGMERKNIAISVLDFYDNSEKNEQLVRDLDKYGSNIVYFLLIETLVKVSIFLKSKGIAHITYHGDLQSTVRRQNLKKFMEDDNCIILATPAFGLGIDKSSIRKVIHYETPGSIEAYFQEIGRAGRDGQPAQGILYFREDDIPTNMEFIKWAFPDKEYIFSFFKLLKAEPDYLLQDGFNHYREKLSFKNKRDYRVESAYSILERWGCVCSYQDLISKDNDIGPKDIIIREPTESDFKNENQKVLAQYQNKKLLSIFQWAKNEDTCRMKRIVEYFDLSGKDCGICDVCRKSNN